MPELPDVTVYVEALRERVVGHHLCGVRLPSPFLLRSVSPPIKAVEGALTTEVRRVGKRIVFVLEDDPTAEPLFLVLHLMIAGRLHWKDEPHAKVPGKIGLAAFDFGKTGTLLLTEAGTKRRASLHLVRGTASLADVADRGGLEVLEASPAEFAEALRRESHTLKRALTDPTLFSGIGNAYSDEILHRARLSPARLSGSLSEEQIARLLEATQAVLLEWTDRIRAEAKKTGGFPEKVTAFREGMAVHGRYGKPCPACGSPIQRIVYAENECNYCPTCQTDGKLLADRALSRLLGADWPRSLDELEQKRASVRATVARS